MPLLIEDGLPLGLYNYGHFTSMLVDQSAVKGLGLHLERLQRDCQLLFGVELDTKEVRRLVRQFTDRSSGPQVVRVTVYDPALELGAPGKSSRLRVLVTTRAGSGAAPKPLRVTTDVYSRELPAVKHVGLFGTIHHRRQAQLAGYDDVLSPMRLDRSAKAPPGTLVSGMEPG